MEGIKGKKTFVIITFFDGNKAALERYLWDHGLEHSLVTDKRSFDVFIDLVKGDL